MSYPRNLVHTEGSRLDFPNSNNIHALARKLICKNNQEQKHTQREAISSKYEKKKKERKRHGSFESQVTLGLGSMGHLVRRYQDFAPIVLLVEIARK